MFRNLAANVEESRVVVVQAGTAFPQMHAR